MKALKMSGLKTTKHFPFLLLVFGLAAGFVLGYIVFHKTPTHAETEKFLSNDTKKPGAFVDSNSLSSKMPQTVNKKIAIIIDDIGHNRSDIKEVLSLNIPLTVAILPFKTYTREAVRLSQKNGLDVFLHLPMEPHNPDIQAGEHAISTQMSEDEIVKWIQMSLENVPDAVGVNNHMGSLVTEDLRVMTIVLRMIRDRNLFFVDSLTTNESSVPLVSRELNIPYLSNELFLDHIDDYEAIKERLNGFESHDTNDDGVVIAIAHPRENTMRALREFIQKFPKDVFLPVSKLAGNQ